MTGGRLTAVAGADAAHALISTNTIDALATRGRT
jgi:hypothetical protein